MVPTSVPSGLSAAPVDRSSSVEFGVAAVAAFAQFREAEVEQLDAPFGQHHVAGLDVAVRDPFAVRARERPREGGRVGQRFVERQRSAREARGERLPVEILHDQELDVVLAAHVVERADVRMIEPRDGPGFALEALAPVRLIGGLGRQDLDGDRASHARVERAIHLAHATPAEERDDLVRTEAGARLQYH